MPTGPSGKRRCKERRGPVAGEPDRTRAGRNLAQIDRGADPPVRLVHTEPLLNGQFENPGMSSETCGNRCAHGLRRGVP